MTLKHSRAQFKIGRSWANYIDFNGLGGEVYTEVPCRTNKQGRSPDVAYLTPQLVAQHGNAKALPQSFPLIAEVISPTDLAEEMISKAQEYLQSGAEEVWLVYPEVGWIMAITQNTRQIFVSGEVISTQNILQGFNISVDELLA